MPRKRQGFTAVSLGLLVSVGMVLAGCQSTIPSNQPSNSDAAKVLKDPAQAMRLADAARKDGDYPSAANAYRRAIDNGGDGYEARIGLASALAGEGDTAAAVTEFRTAQAMSPTRPEPHLGVGRLQLVQNKPNEALAEFDAALKLSPTVVSGWNGKGYALDMLERHQEAQEAYRAGLALDPDDHVLANNYGLSLALSGDYNASVTVLTKLVQEPGATARNRQNLALALGLQGDNTDARLIAETDLSKSQVDANLAFYNTVRRAPIPTQSAAIPVPAPSMTVSGTNRSVPGASTNTAAVTNVSLPPPGDAVPTPGDGGTSGSSSGGVVSAGSAPAPAPGEGSSTPGASAQPLVEKSPSAVPAQ